MTRRLPLDAAHARSRQVRGKQAWETPPIETECRRFASPASAPGEQSIATNCDGFGKSLRIRFSSLPTARERMDRCYWTYIMASRRNGTLYIGVTNDIVRRTWQQIRLIETMNPEWRDLYELVTAR